MESLDWLGLIPALPLAACVIALFCRSGLVASLVSIAGMGAAMIPAFRAFSLSRELDAPATFDFTWMTIAGKSIDFGFVLDPLSGSMVAMVTFVGFLIFVYAGSYMKDDPRRGRFFVYLSLFAAGMLGLVLSNSLLLLFMSWEIVGVTSYLLISFWFHKPSAAAAGKKAFITTRIGDLGFLVAILWAFKSTGSLLFYADGDGLLEGAALEVLRTEPGFWGISAAGVVGLLLFVGAIGKSGQLPLHVWLPDAMEGPTPVSALIHAATMVAAGVFLVARAFPLFAFDQVALEVIAWVGAATALFAALAALGQYDLKRILAFSTVSQLGLMMVGLAAGGVAVGMFHLHSHAFFKALLFLGAGSIIHGCGDEQDIRKMGGVFRMKLTTFVYLCGAVALCAVPFTSGFFSKDEILASAYHDWPGVFWICALASLLTAVYVTRQCLYVFPGKHRGSRGEPHESPPQMTAPLLVLAAFALAFGYFAMDRGALGYFGNYEPAEHTTLVVIVGWGVSLGGILLGYLAYARKPLGEECADPLATLLGKAYLVMENKFYVDELYAATVHRVWGLAALLVDVLDAILVMGSKILILATRAIAYIFHHAGDRIFIDRWTFDGTCEALRESSELATWPQNGFLSGYLRWIAIGAVVFGFLVIGGCS
ncbi:MAG: NADH-quinone oxidoreductase subunit L [Opitutales bacterium]